MSTDIDWSEAACATFRRIEAHVMQDPRDTTVGAIAEALGLSCSQVVREIEERGYWIVYVPDEDQPIKSWTVLLEGE